MVEKLTHAHKQMQDFSKDKETIKKEMETNNSLGLRAG